MEKIELKKSTMYFTSNIEKVIEQVNYTIDRGVIIEDTGNFPSHIEKVSKKVRQKCGLIKRTFSTRNPAFL